MPRPLRRAALVFLYFARRTPYRTAFLLVCVLLAGLLEGLGIAALLPLLNIVLKGTAETSSKFGQMIQSAMEVVGLPPTLESILGAIVVLITIKSALLVYSATQIGYTAAHVAKLLRNQLVTALMQAR
jgi:ATP-binding cassette subfamily C protein